MGAVQSHFERLDHRHMMVHATALPEAPAHADNTAIAATKTTYVLPEPQYIKAEGPGPWLLHKLAVVGGFSLAWLLMSSVAAVAGEVRHLSNDNAQLRTQVKSGGCRQAPKLSGELKQLKRENAKLQAQASSKHAKAWKEAIAGLKKGERKQYVQMDLLKMSNKRLQQRVQALRRAADDGACKRDDEEAAWMQSFENAYLRKTHGLQAVDD